MSDKKKVKVRSYERQKPDKEDGTGVEIPNVAPESGPEKIVQVPPPGERRGIPGREGVKIIGGSIPKRTDK